MFMKFIFTSSLILLTLSLFGFGEIKDPKTIAAEAKERASHLTAEAFLKMREDHPDLLLIDVRTKGEYEAGHIEGAVLIPRGTLEFAIQKKTIDPDRLIVVYCRTGGRGSLSALALESIGYRNVYDLEGGFRTWAKAGLPVYNLHGEIKVIAYDEGEN